jgi:hypothetical protein
VERKLPRTQSEVKRVEPIRTEFLDGPGADLVGLGAVQDSIMDIEEAREMMKMVDTSSGKMSMEDANTIWCVLNKLHCSEATIKFLRGELTKVCAHRSAPGRPALSTPSCVRIEPRARQRGMRGGADGVHLHAAVGVVAPRSSGTRRTSCRPSPAWRRRST